MKNKALSFLALAAFGMSVVASQANAVATFDVRGGYTFGGKEKFSSVSAAHEVPSSSSSYTHSAELEGLRNWTVGANVAYLPDGLGSDQVKFGAFLGANYSFEKESKSLVTPADGGTATYEIQLTKKGGIELFAGPTMMFRPMENMMVTFEAGFGGSSLTVTETYKTVDNNGAVSSSASAQGSKDLIKGWKWGTQLTAAVLFSTATAEGGFAFGPMVRFTKFFSVKTEKNVTARLERNDTETKLGLSGTLEAGIIIKYIM